MPNLNIHLKDYTLSFIKLNKFLRYQRYYRDQALTHWVFKQCQVIVLLGLEKGVSFCLSIQK